MHGQGSDSTGIGISELFVDSWDFFWPSSNFFYDFLPGPWFFQSRARRLALEFLRILAWFCFEVSIEKRDLHGGGSGKQKEKEWKEN